MSELSILKGVQPVMCCLSGSLVNNSYWAYLWLEARLALSKHRLPALLLALSQQGNTGEQVKDCSKYEPGSTVRYFCIVFCKSSQVRKIIFAAVIKKSVFKAVVYTSYLLSSSGLSSWDFPVSFLKIFFSLLTILDLAGIFLLMNWHLITFFS